MTGREPSAVTLSGAGILDEKTLAGWERQLWQEQCSSRLQLFPLIVPFFLVFFSLRKNWYSKVSSGFHLICSVNTFKGEAQGVFSKQEQEQGEAVVV